MKLLLTTIAAVVLVGCGNPEADRALIDATEAGDIESIKQHVANGADVNAKDVFMGMTPLHYAAVRGHKEIAELLIANGADVNAKRGDFTTPLHFAAGGGHKEVAELLIAVGADVNAKDNIEWTPLHRAVLEGQKDVIELLIAAGADVNAKGDDGKTPLDWVDFSGPETADLLRKHGGKKGKELKAAETVAEASQAEPPTAKAPDILIHSAAMLGNIEAVKQHLAAGTDVNAKLGWMTPLHLAASEGHKEVVELLIANDADVNAKANDGETPLNWAIKNKHTETADLLRKHGGKTGEELKAEGK